ncbi:acetyl-CoA carboxylase biotin carboxyl carrier protein [Methylobacterium nigriterrae]|uniref:acetyl-CoA carboxylase biotin carboxyl carrier protein n=1 Tax=Methylobacterium nigriterrae TaxID=3127512 RepID=UPI003013BAE5
MRYDQVADLIKIVDSSACEELILETADLKLVVRRGRAGAPEPASPAPISASSPTDRASTGSTAPPATASPAPPASPTAAAAKAGGHEVRAPMVGTFYRAPSPDAPPFVEVGSVIGQGQPLCVIEVMKLFTTIYADRAGTISDIPAKNGEFVEFDQVMFVIQAP